jgi:hypothetical protein
MDAPHIGPHDTSGDRHGPAAQAIRGLCHMRQIHR